MGTGDVRPPRDSVFEVVMMSKLMDRGGLALAKVVKELYREGQTDYLLEPIVSVRPNMKPVGQINDGDTVIFCLRRGEREIQLTRAFVDPNFGEFPRKDFKDLSVVTLTLYHEMFASLPVAFPPMKLEDTLGEVISKKGLKQLRIAESEKFAHVTFFFNGRSNKPFPGEDDIVVPSRKGVPVREAPEQSISLVTERAIKAVSDGKYDFIVVNFANGDIVGHIDDINAKMRCAEIVDKHLEMLLLAAAKAGYVSIVTADHGVLEEAAKEDGTVNIGHTANPVPFIIFDPLPGFQGFDTTDNVRRYRLEEGRELGSVAPTVLDLMGIEKPPAMTSQSLIKNPIEDRTARRVLLVVMDGWGIGRNDQTNPIYAGRTPTWNWLKERCPFTTLRASGEAVGLEDWKMGNSESGHMNMAAGRVVPQDDFRIDNAFRNGSIRENKIFIEAMQRTRGKGSTLHLIALLSKMSSHGSVDYAVSLLGLAKELGLHQVCIHLIFDGRSTTPGSAPTMLLELNHELDRIGLGVIASGVGRGYALDRDGNYKDRTRLAYEALVYGKGRPAVLTQLNELEA